MVAIKTDIKELPEYCEQCKYYYLRARGKSGYSDICEISGERMDYGECKDGWYYNGLTRPDNCPLMEVEDDK